MISKLVSQVTKGRGAAGGGGERYHGYPCNLKKIFIIRKSEEKKTVAYYINLNNNYLGLLKN